MPAVIAFGAVQLASGVQTVPDPDRVSPGFAGFAVMFLLAVATIVLIRSMTTHLRKARFLAEPPDSESGQSQRAGDVVHDQRIDSGAE